MHGGAHGHARLAACSTAEFLQALFGELVDERSAIGVGRGVVGLRNEGAARGLFIVHVEVAALLAAGAKERVARIDLGVQSTTLAHHREARREHNTRVVRAREFHDVTRVREVLRNRHVEARVGGRDAREMHHDVDVTRGCRVPRDHVTRIAERVHEGLAQRRVESGDVDGRLHGAVLVDDVGPRKWWAAPIRQPADDRTGPYFKGAVEAV